MHRTRILTLAFILAANVFSAATPPALVNYQGVLRDGSGNPRSGNFDMVFWFYDQSSGGTLLLADTHNSGAPSGPVAVSNGLFTVQLGAGTIGGGAVPNLAAVFRDYAAVWLEIQVGTETLAPRVRVVSSAYAQNARTLDGSDAEAFVAVAPAGTSRNIVQAPLPSVIPLTLSGAFGQGTDLQQWKVYGGTTALSVSNGGTLILNPQAAKGVAGSVNTAMNVIDVSNAGSGIPIYGATTSTAGPIPTPAIEGFSHGSGSVGNIGIWGFATNSPASNEGIGGWGSGDTGTKTGVSGTASGLGTNNGGRFSAEDPTASVNYGVYSAASGGGSNYAGHFQAANSGGNNYGVYALANGATGTNWAGYFDSTVYIKSGLGIGTSSSAAPAFPLDVQAAQGVARLTSTGNANGSVLVLKNSTASPAGIGAINFNDSAPGQIAYLANNDMTFRTNGADRMRLDSSGYLGLGLDASYQLQLSADSAAKPGTNTWTVASDRRLKRDIAPFTDGLAVIEKIDPVRYRYNGLAQLPAGEENIGVVAQDIQAVAPYTVRPFMAKLNERDARETELLGFNSHALTFVTINAVKELDARLSKLEGRRTAPEPAAAHGPVERQAEPGVAETASAAAVQPSVPAPLLEVSPDTQAGEVLVIVPNNGADLHPCYALADPMVVGIALADAADGRAPVATSGIAFIKADATLFAIAKGDLLVTSPTPGHAMKASKPIEPGTVLGKALEDLPAGAGLIRVLVMLR